MSRLILFHKCPVIAGRFYYGFAEIELRTTAIPFHKFTSWMSLPASTLGFLLNINLLWHIVKNRLSNLGKIYDTVYSENQNIKN